MKPSEDTARKRKTENMDVCLKTVYTPLGNRLASVDELVTAHAKACAARLEKSRKPKKRRAY